MSLLAALARVGAGLAVAGACGACVSRPFTGGLTRREKAAWSLACGLLVQEAGLLALFALRVRPRAATLILFEALVAAAGLALSRRRRPSLPEGTPRGPSWAVFSLLAVASAAWLVFLVGSVSDAMWATDFVAFWGYKGKIVSQLSTIPRRLFEDPGLYFAHPEYPLLVPLTLASLAAFAGEWNDQALALVYPACALATLLALSGFLSRRVSRLSGAAASALAALCFFLYRPANAGTAEIPLALGFVLACCAAADAVRNVEASPGVSRLAALAAAALFCVGLKQEGALFVLLLAATVVWTLRGSFSPAGRRLAAAALVVPVLVHGAALALLTGSHGRRDFDLTLLEPRRWAELPGLGLLVAGRLLGTEARQNAVALLAVGVYLTATRRGGMDFLLPAFVAQLLCYAIEPMFSIDPVWSIESAFARIVLTLFPAFTLVLGARAGPLGDSVPAAPRT